MRNKEKGSSFMIGQNNRHPPDHVVSLPCTNYSEELINESFGSVCEVLRKKYGCRCGKICLMLKKCHDHIAISFDREIADIVQNMNDTIVLLNNDAKIKETAREIAQLLEIHSVLNKRETRRNNGYGKHHKLTDDDLTENFLRSPAAKRDFPRRWAKMLEEMHDCVNPYYAREKFETPNPTFKELFWTYLFGGAVENFGIRHPEEELSGIPQARR